MQWQYLSEVNHQNTDVSTVKPAYNGILYFAGMFRLIQALDVSGVADGCSVVQLAKAPRCKTGRSRVRFPMGS